MGPTRKTQPYRATGSRAPSQVLDTMLAGRAAGGGNALIRAAARPMKRKKRANPLTGDPRALIVPTEGQRQA